MGSHNKFDLIYFVTSLFVYTGDCLTKIWRK